MHRLLSTLFLNVLSILLFSQTNDIDRLLKLGIKSHEEGKNKIAIQYYDSILAKNPNDTIALYNKGIACLNTNKKKDAEDCFQKVLKINPNHYNSLNEISKMYEKPEAIPLFCLMKMNIIYYKSNLSIENYQKIQDIFHKFNNVNDTSLKAISNIPRFRNAIKNGIISRIIIVK